ncbi:hypothetical protein GCM10019016_098420 [Streptomyces prasinosporus]|uniref:Uncharacterized protein n=1 Tax=Streptomyces prasinosporus TaxID=68256 RepID=A0ABP6U7M6_9ACTN
MAAEPIGPIRLRGGTRGVRGIDATARAKPPAARCRGRQGRVTRPELPRTQPTVTDAGAGDGSSPDGPKRPGRSVHGVPGRYLNAIASITCW